MDKIKVKPVFIKTKNYLHFEAMMAGLQLGEGEGRFGLMWGKAGRGKTRAAQRFMAEKQQVYLKMLTIWNRSELGFLQSLMKELGIIYKKENQNTAFFMIIDALLKNPQTIFLDEVDIVSAKFLNIARDIAELTGISIVLIGEEDILSMVKTSGRVSSRIFQEVEFSPLGESDIIAYINTAASLKINAEQANGIVKKTGGDFRLVRRATLKLVQICNAKQTKEIANEMILAAVSTKL